MEEVPGDRGRPLEQSQPNWADAQELENSMHQDSRAHLMPLALLIASVHVAAAAVPGLRDAGSGVLKSAAPFCALAEEQAQATKYRLAAFFFAAGMGD